MPQSRYLGRLAWIPLPLFLVAITAFTWLRPDAVWDPWLFVISLNVIFQMGASFFVAALAARSHLTAPSVSILLLGAGALTLGLAGAATGWTLIWRDANAMATMFRSLACLSAFCHIASASTDLWPRAQRISSRWPLVAAVYSAVAAVAAVLFWLMESGRMPPFFVPGAGAAVAGYVANAVGGALFTLAAIVMLAHSNEQTAWKRWYAYGLGLLALSLLALSLQSNLGDPMSWLSRLSRFMGIVYLLAAVLGSVRPDGAWVIPLEAALRQSEENLRSANERLALALRAGGAGFFDWDMKEGTVFRSPEQAALLGSTQGFSSWSRDSWLERIAPEDRPNVEAIERQCIEQRRKNFTLEFRARVPGLGTRWFCRQGALYYDESGAPVRMIGINMDITERKRAARHAEAISAINEVIHSTLDSDKIMQRVVSSAAEALGCQTATISLREQSGWTVRYVHGFPNDIIGCQKGDEAEPHAVAAIETRKPVAINDALNDPRARCGHMAERNLRAILVVPLIARDEAIGVLSLSHQLPGLTFDEADVDFAGKLASSLSLALQNARLWREVQKELAQRKRIEEALRQLNTELEARVAERTAQLVQAQKLEALGQLTGGLAHDFNNLLAVILGNVELLRKRLGPDEKALRLANNAIEGAERGAALTRRMLAFARRQELQPDAVGMAQVVKGLMAVLRSSLGSAIDVHTSFPDDLWLAQVDSNQLELALLNVAVNARDAIREKPGSGGSGALTLSARNEVVPFGDAQLAAGDYVVLSVTDNGVGMTEETLARAADPFFTTKGLGKGTGLGLSMVQGLAVQSGGALRLSSTFGEGATVELWLPRAWLEPHHEARHAAAPLPGNSATVLVVDDDALVCVATADMLVDLGHRVYEAQSARQALEILNSGAKVDLVVTDHIMPEMTGLQLTREIEARWPGLPAILATGYTDSPADEDLKIPRLNKPYDLNTLAAAVTNALRCAKATASA